MPRRLLSTLWFAPLLLLFWNLGYAPFWNPDEGRYASASLEMAHPLEAGPADWLIPHLNTAIRLNKPPLVYWAGAGAFRLLGPSESHGRLPSALAALIVAVVLFDWGRRAFDRRTGQIAALIWGSMVLPFAMGRVLNTDMLLACAVTLGSYGLWEALRQRENSEPEGTGSENSGLPWKAALIAGLGMGLALLAKGPVGVALPLAVAFLYLCCTRGWRRAPWSALLVALLVALAIGGPWFLAVEARRPGFLHTFIIEENFGRLTGSQQYHTKSSKLYYLPIMLLGMLPWTGFVCAVFGQWTRGLADRRVRLFALLWAGFIILFFSLSGTKLVSYVLPAFPPLALVMGAALGRWEFVGGRARNLTIAATAFLNLLLAAVGGAFLLDNKILPRHVALPAVVLLAAILLSSTVALLLVARRASGKPLVMVQVSTACLLFVLLLPLAGRISLYEDCSIFFKLLRPRLQPGDRIVGFNSFMPTATFYCRRPVYFLGFTNNSGLITADLRQRRYFPGYDEDKAWDPDFQRAALKNITDGHRAWIWSKGRIDVDLEKQLHLWGRNNDFFFYSNLPKPADFSFDRVAPRKRAKGDKPTRKGQNLPGQPGNPPLPLTSADLSRSQP